MRNGSSALCGRGTNTRCTPKKVRSVWIAVPAPQTLPARIAKAAAASTGRSGATVVRIRRSATAMATGAIADGMAAS